jgi:hypothetical protein
MQNIIMQNTTIQVLQDVIKTYIIKLFKDKSFYANRYIMLRERSACEFYET